MGSVPIIKRCPPSLKTKSAASGAKTVRVSTLIESLEYMQKWTGEIAGHLKKLEGDPVISTGKTTAKAKAKKTAKKKK